MKIFDKYQRHLSLVKRGKKEYVQSYSTLVAEIDYWNEKLIVLGWWSKTTSKHINYVAEQLDLTIIHKNQNTNNEKAN